MPNVLGSLEVELSANTAKFVESLDRAASSSRKTSNEITNNFSAMRRASAELNASLATENLGTEKIISARRNIISLAEKQIQLARQEGLEHGRNLATLRSATNEIERQKNALAGGGAFTNATAQIVNAIKLRASTANIPGLGGMGGMLSVRAFEPVGKFAEEGAGKLEAAFGSAIVPIAGAAAAIAALGVAAAGVTHHMMELSQSIENTAAATGLSTKQVQEYNELAKEMGVDEGSLQMAFARIQTQLGEFISTGRAAGNGSQNFVRIMKEMGVALTDAQGKLRPVNDIVGDFGDKLSKIPDAETRAALEMAALGTRGRVLAQVMEEAAREGLSLRDALSSIDKSGNVIPDSQLDNLMKAKRHWDDLMRSIRGVKTEFEGFIAESLTSWKGLERGAATVVAAFLPLTSKFGQSLVDKYFPEGGGANKGGPGAGGNPMLMQQIAAENEKLQERASILRAGGQMQLQLNQAEDAYSMAVASHAIAMATNNTELAGQKQLEIQGYAQEISSLKEIIALEQKKGDLTRVEKEYSAAAQAYTVAAVSGEKELVAQKARQLAQYDAEIAHLKEILHLVESTASFASVKPSFAAPIYHKPSYEPGATDALMQKVFGTNPATVPNIAAVAPSVQDISGLTGASITATFDKSVEVMGKLHDKWLESIGDAVSRIKEEYNRDLENFTLLYEEKRITAAQFSAAQIELAAITNKKLTEAEKEGSDKFVTVSQRMHALLEDLAASGEEFGRKIFASMSRAIDGIAGAIAHMVVTGQNSFRQLFQSLSEELLKASIQKTFSSIAAQIEKHAAAAANRPMSEQPPNGAVRGISGTLEKVFGIKTPGMKRDGTSAASALYVIPVGAGPGGGAMSGIATSGSTGGILDLLKSKSGPWGGDSSNPMAGLGIDNSLPNLPKPQESGKAAAAAAAMQTAGSIFKKIWAAKHGDDSSDDSDSSSNSRAPSFGGGGFNFLSLLGMFGGFRAAGGDVTPGKAYIVGENHPEVFVPRAAGRVVPKIETGPGGHSTTVNLHIHGVADADSFQRSSTQIYSHLHSQLAMAHARNG